MSMVYSNLILKVTESVIESVNYILDANVSDTSASGNIANTSSLILQAVEQQIAQTLEKHGQLESIKPNIAVKGVTVNPAQRALGIGFEISRTDEGFNRKDNRSGRDTSSTSSIRLPNDALFGNTGEASRLNWN